MPKPGFEPKPRWTKCKVQSAKYSHMSLAPPTKLRFAAMAKAGVFLLLVLLQGTVTWAAEDSSLTFLVLGDWGGQQDPPYTTPAEVELAGVMGKKAAEIGSQFTLALGDNFYHEGVKNVNDKRFNETFENVFTASSLQSPWYVVCGNHDHYGNCSAEIAYSKVSNRWNFPDYYYAKEFSIPGTDSSVEILFIDTVILAGLTHPLFRSIPPDGPASLKAADQQWTFINQTLAKWASYDKPTWKIVVGHYPVWSIAEHGPTETLVKNLKPLLEQYLVTAYFCGHDHNMQHLTDSGVQYYVVGAGHLTDPSNGHKNSVPKDSLKYFYGPRENEDSSGAFAAVTATASEFTVTYYNDKMEKLYVSSITK